MRDQVEKPSNIFAYKYHAKLIFKGGANFGNTRKFNKKNPKPQKTLKSISNQRQPPEPPPFVFFSPRPNSPHSTQRSRPPPVSIFGTSSHCSPVYFFSKTVSRRPSSLIFFPGGWPFQSHQPQPLHLSSSSHLPPHFLLSAGSNPQPFLFQNQTEAAITVFPTENQPQLFFPRSSPSIDLLSTAPPSKPQSRCPQKPAVPHRIRPVVSFFSRTAPSTQPN